MHAENSDWKLFSPKVLNSLRHFYSIYGVVGNVVKTMK